MVAPDRVTEVPTSSPSVTLSPFKTPIAPENLRNALSPQGQRMWDQIKSPNKAAIVEQEVDLSDSDLEDSDLELSDSDLELDLEPDVEPYGRSSSDVSDKVLEQYGISPKKSSSSWEPGQPPTEGMEAMGVDVNDPFWQVNNEEPTERPTMQDLIKEASNAEVKGTDNLEQAYNGLISPKQVVVMTGGDYKAQLSNVLQDLFALQLKLASPF